MKNIAIHSVPRSGSSWVGQIFNSSQDVNFRFQPLFSYTFKDYLNQKSSLNDVNTFFDLINKSDDDLLANTIEEVENIFNFCNLEIREQTANFLIQSSRVNQDDRCSVYKRKIKDDTWRNTLNPRIVEAITKDLIKSNIEKYIE